MILNFKDKYAEYLNVFCDYLTEYFSSIKGIPENLYSAMEYAVSGGGKRVRPVLCLAISDMLGVDVKKTLPFALAIEMIHSYSLVHDDLPAMDNDDYRRGKLSTHKKYGEAMGILAGDGLLNLAYEILLSVNDFSLNELKASRIIADYAGSKGMINGQVLDIEGENADNVSESALYDIVINKTAKLITAPILVASSLGGDKYFNELKEYGYNLGLLFQTTDDIFDATSTFEEIGKTPHKDENKITAIKVYGLEGAKLKASIYYENCKKILDLLPNNSFLSDFTDYIYTRKN